MMGKCRSATILVGILILWAVTPASALILVGRGNAPVTDQNWRAGALDVANLKTRVGWWEGPPFGGGQWSLLSHLRPMAFARCADCDSPGLHSR